MVFSTSFQRQDSYPAHATRTGASLSPAGKVRYRGAHEVEKGRGGVPVLNKAPFPLPASRTGQADFPHPALTHSFTAQDLLRSGV
jgi:hypothetical protein